MSNQRALPLWDAILRSRVRAYGRLAGERRERFLAYVARFLREKRFVAKARMVLDDDVRVTIAGTAVRMVLDIGFDHLECVRSVTVYPHSVQHEGELSAGCVIARGRELEVHLGWAQVLRGLEDPRDGYDVLLHEFAHVLDHEDGAFDGVPRLRATQDYELWSHVLHSNFFSHWFDQRSGEAPVLRPYARTSPAEFFAVASEAFFEKPELLARVLPDLYFKLKRFYGTDP